MATTAAVLAALFWWLGFSVVIAQQVPPHVFVGTAAVDGKPMADGKPVTAWINGEKVGKSVVDGGTYTLVVVEPAGRSFDGKKISFKIGNLEAHEIGLWKQGGGTELHLTGTTSGSGTGSEKQKLLQQQALERQRAEHNQKLEREQLSQSQESARQETRLETRRLELQSHRELERQRISQDRQRAAREAQFDLERQRAARKAQLDLDRQSLEPEYPELGIFMIKGQTDQDRKAAGSVPRRKKPSGRGFFTNSANGDVGGFGRTLDPTTLAVIGILLTLVATSTSLFKGN